MCGFLQHTVAVLSLLILTMKHLARCRLLSLYNYAMPMYNFVMSKKTCLLCCASVTFVNELLLFHSCDLSVIGLVNPHFRSLQAISAGPNH